MLRSPDFQLEDIARALGLLSRLPVRVNPEAASERGARAAWAYPLAGCVIGLIGGATAWIGLAIGFPPGPAAAFALAALALATGALHEDGLADTADGLWGGATPERRLEIMKDSRIGTFGVLALILVTITRWSALAALLASGSVFAPILAAAVLSRAPMVVMMQALSNARPAGLSAAQGKPGMPAVWAALAIATVAGLVALGGTFILAALVTTVACIPLAMAARARIGGQTGDILGASQQVAEAAVLATAAASL